MEWLFDYPFISLLWNSIKRVSEFIKPAADVIKPLHDMGAFTIAVVIAVVTFLSRRKLKMKLDQIEKAIGDGADEPWLLYRAEPHKKRRWFFQRQNTNNERDTKYVCFYNQKGGVGKTTLAMNFAAYLDHNLHKHVLLIDLDYQGSLSNAMLAACNIKAVESTITEIFDKKLFGEDLLKLTVSLREKISVVKPETRLPRTEIIVANYPFGKLENRLMLRWLVQESYKNDVRYILSYAIRSPAIRRKFDVVILDCPPRLTTGTVNALCASTHIVVPTVLDDMSAEAVGPTLQTVKRLSDKLNPSLQLIGVVGNLTRNDELGKDEREAVETVRFALRQHGWGDSRLFGRTIPRRQAVIRALGESIPYLEDNQFRQLFDQLGDEMSDVLGLRAPVEKTEPEARTSTELPADARIATQPA